MKLKSARKGQVAIVLVAILFAILTLALLDAGVFLAVRAKNRAMNAGDAAAIAAARRQGALLNEIGRLNLEHAVAEIVQLSKQADERDWSECEKIVRRQRRLCFLGPLECQRDADAAAEKNGAEVSACACRCLRKHVGEIRDKYAKNPDLYPEPWDGAWEEYAAELDQVSGNIRASCDNIQFYDAISHFPLTSLSFYNMVKGRSWCKIVVAGWKFLLDQDLSKMNLPDPTPRTSIVNPEICPLHLAADCLPAMDAEERRAFVDALLANGAEFPEGVDPYSIPPDDDMRSQDDESRIYFFYDGDSWGAWSGMIAKLDYPIVGTVKPEFDVRGCSATYCVSSEIPRFVSVGKKVDDEYEWRELKNGVTNKIVWAAAAKPFGTVLDPQGGGRCAVTADFARQLVMPGFEEVRLVPLDLVESGRGGTADEDWLEHVREHVALLSEQGVGALAAGCEYCDVLRKWNDPNFRAQVQDWIREHEEMCRRGSAPSRYSGGAQNAH